MRFSGFLWFRSVRSVAGFSVLVKVVVREVRLLAESERVLFLRGSGAFCSLRFALRRRFAFFVLRTRFGFISSS